MKTHTTHIEVLEARIAPALLINGANLLGGAGNPTTGETSINGNTVVLVEVVQGQALVWYDSNFNSIAGISVGPNTYLKITGDILGDIVTNLGANGRLSDSNFNPLDGEDGGILFGHNIAGLETKPLGGQEGSVRRIIAGGSISNVTISGELTGLYAGNGVFRPDAAVDIIGGTAVSVPVGIDVNPLQPGIQGGFLLDIASSLGFARSGAAIKNIDLAEAFQLQAFAGDGASSATGKGKKGGSITDFKIGDAYSAEPATPAYELRAGDGGSGTHGGKGGSILRVLELSSSGLVFLKAGDGGNADIPTSSGTPKSGGEGGSIQSTDLRGTSTSYQLRGGNGGDGLKGGSGGSLLNNELGGRGPENAFLVAADFNLDGHEDILSVNAGTGEMVISLNVPGSDSFIFQFQEDGIVGNNPTPIIPPKGATPTAAVVRDFNGDGFLDIAVGYKNTGNLFLYFAFDHGVFRNPFNGDVNAITFSFDLPVLGIAMDNFFGGPELELAVLLSGPDKTSVQLIEYIQPLVNGTPEPQFVSVGLETKLRENTTAGAPSLPLAVDIVSADLNGAGGKDLFVAFDNGDLYSLIHIGGGPLNAHFEITAAVNLGPKLDSLSVNPGSPQLLAFASSTRLVQLFNFSSGSLVLEAVQPPLGSFTGVLQDATFLQVAPGTYQVAIAETKGLESTVHFLAFDIGSQTWAIAKQIAGPGQVGKLVAVNETGSFGVAGITAAINRFYFSNGNSAFAEFALPFEGKLIDARGGNGGDAIVPGATKSGGNGGSIIGFNGNANEILLFGGSGGDATAGKGGNGGRIDNATPFTSYGGTSITPSLVAEQNLAITGGNGGDATEEGPKAKGGNGGDSRNVLLKLASGLLTLGGGDAGDGFGADGGRGGGISLISASVGAVALNAFTGSGGSAAGGAGNGGRGGDLRDFTFSMEQSAPQDTVEAAYAMVINTGSGGNSASGKGGRGGNARNLDLTLDPSNESVTSGGGPSTTLDSTLSVFLRTGDGGDGRSSGGNGGKIQTVQSVTTLDQVFTTGVSGGTVRINPVVFTVNTGNGGSASDGKGGNGGSATGLDLTGVTRYDEHSVEVQFIPPLVVQAGNGGNGSEGGGDGGSIVSVKSRNATVDGNTVVATNMLAGAFFIAGEGGNSTGGNGGNGGSVKEFSAAVQSTTLFDGSLEVVAGGGGAAPNGKGGKGGNVLDGTAGAVDFNSVTGRALFFVSGNGGDGNAGGNGGKLGDVRVNSPIQNDAYASTFLAGHGGDASGAGQIGGNGGDIFGIRQNKDLNSAMNLLSAGDGGNASGVGGNGGNGGNIKDVKTIGFIGKPSDGLTNLGVFDSGREQGVFAGRGGDGATDGTNGSVTNIVARQIAAIGANPGVGNLFGAASKIAKITADLIGYDANANNAFNNANSDSQNPGVVVPIDGFLFGSSISKITTFNPARTQAFTFFA